MAPEGEEAAMGSTHSYDRESFLDEFFPDPDERAEVEAGARQLRASVSRRRSVVSADTNLDIDAMRLSRPREPDDVDLEHQ
jgi:hypothetical protein